MGLGEGRWPSHYLACEEYEISGELASLVKVSIAVEELGVPWEVLLGSRPNMDW
jgi:hypothetical protein